MRKKVSRHWIISLVMVGLIAGVCCDNSVGQTPQPGGIIKVRKPLNITGVDPHKVNSLPDFNIWNNVVEGLVAMDGMMNVQPMLAEKWEVKDDGLTYLFTLRKGVKFHDGKEMTAEDVKYSLERVKAESPRKSDLADVTKIDVMDKYQIKITLKQRVGPFLAYLANPYTLAIIPKDYAKPGETIKKPIGTGPYKFAEWQPDILVRLERFSDYKPVDYEASGLAGKKIPYFDGAIFRFISEPATTNAGLETGQLDYSRSNTLTDAQRLARNPIVKYYSFPSYKTWSLWFNLKHPLLSNRKFREAMCCAVDKQAILEGALWGEGLVANSHIAPQLNWFSDEHKLTYPYNPEKAKSLLKEMGYKGEKLLLQPATHPIMQRTATVAQTQLKAVGINAEIQTLDFPKFMEFYQKGGYEILVAGHPYKGDPDTIYNALFHSTKKYTGNGFSNKELDALVERAYEATDFKERKKLYGQCQKIIFNEIAYIPVIHDNLIYVLNGKIEGFKPFGGDFTTLWNMWFKK